MSPADAGRMDIEAAANDDASLDDAAPPDPDAARPDASAPDARDATVADGGDARPTACEGSGSVDVPMPATQTSPHRPNIAWTGEGYGVVWRDADGALFALIDRDGNYVEGSVRTIVPRGDRSITPHNLAWSGSEFGVVLSENSLTTSTKAVVFMRLDASGEPIAGSRVETIADENPRQLGLAWSPVLSEWGMAWDEGFLVDYTVWFQRFDVGGVLVPDSRVIVTEGEFAYISHYGTPVIWTGTRFAVGWSASGDCSVAEIGEDGAASAPIVLSSNGKHAYGVTLEPNGSGYAAAWVAGRDTTASVFFARFDDQGLIAGSETETPGRLDHTGQPTLDLTWNGTEYGVVWAPFSAFDESLPDLNVSFMRVDANGAVVPSSHREIACSPLAEHGPSMATDGTQWVIASQRESRQSTQKSIHVLLVQ